MKYIILIFSILALHINSSKAQDSSLSPPLSKTDKEIKVGAEQLEKYLPLIQDKTVAVVANQTSRIKNTHLVDSLLALGIKIKVVFTPEHGFRGTSSAGEPVPNAVDEKTSLPIISLYGNNYKPSAKDLTGVDIVIFDIQDVGARFYTYISTMHYMMEACAESNISFLVLDRPNPNGFYVDGPILEEKYKSFVGLHPVPIVHGMTVAEYAKMINGESWLRDSLNCKLVYIPVEGYTHADYYQLPVKPSPNLPNMSAVYLYPSLALFEGTIVSVGRGTNTPFQVIGYPGFKDGTYSFTPRSIPDAAKNPPYLGQTCKGFNLSQFGEAYIRNLKGLYLYWLKAFYDSAPNKKKIFNPYFNSLAGTAKLKNQIIQGISEENIKKSWEEDLKKFKSIRKKYLLYPDFE